MILAFACPKLKRLLELSGKPKTGVDMLSTQPTLNEREWSLVLELLESEMHELPVELRHTDSRSYAEALDDRRAMLDSLIHRLRSEGVVA